MRHFRSAIHSKFIANISRFVGHDVVNVTHVQDWGLKTALLNVGYKQFGIPSELTKNPAVHLSDVMTASIHQYKNDLNFRNTVKVCFQKMEEGDEEILSEWRELKYHFLEHNDLLYKRMGLNFDDTFFDSANFEEIKRISDKLLTKKLISINDNGKVAINLSDENKEESIIFHNDDFDSALYHFSRCIYAAIHRKEKYNSDVTYYVAASSQKNFFMLLLSLIKKLDFQWSEELQHIKLKNINNFEMKRGKKLEIGDILNEAKVRMLNKLQKDLQLEVDENLDEMAEILGISSLCINDMKRRRSVDYQFAWDEIIQFGKHSAASFQFCHAGLKGLQEDSEYKFKIDIDTSPLLEPEAHSLIQHLSKFDEIVYKSYLYLEPCIIFQYLASLWYYIDKATNILKLDIKGDRLVVIKARLLLLSATLKVLQKGLYLLGVTPLENTYSPKQFSI